ncbi:helix-turn-helix domain-containing protein [Aromatoleum toluclasticum]|uniref:helix-turn-helix domain-containing protein n=1 Tax=Aromatoleum toluclasticum TaxID=92003 RepID=UPI0003632882|nr:helix-turn-helix transcriptional regulator [Aromatoleum toluclasticum]
MTTVQDTILKLRQRGLSQSEIGRAVGIPQPRISRWESGDVPDPVEDGLRLVEFLNRLERESERGDHPPPSKPRPLPESGQGAKLGCQTADPASTDDAVMIAAARQGDGKGTVEGDCGRDGIVPCV